MEPVKVGDVYDMARACMNDTIGMQYTNTVLEPYFRIAYDDLKMICEDNNLPFGNQTSAPITVTAGVIDIGGDTGPALPADMIDLIELYERISGTDNDYQMMRNMRFLPKTEQRTMFLEVYAWQNNVIKFIGALSDIQVKIDYVANKLGKLVNENTLITLYNSKNFLGFATASYAARYIGENPTRADSLAGDAGNALEKMENIPVKSQQNMPVRRKPFMANYRQRGWTGYR